MFTSERCGDRRGDSCLKKRAQETIQPVERFALIFAGNSRRWRSSWIISETPCSSPVADFVTPHMVASETIQDHPPDPWSEVRSMFQW